MRILMKVILVIALLSCRKPRNGNYTMESTWTEIRTYCTSGGTNCSSDTVPLTSGSSTVHIKNYSETSFSVDDNNWTRNGSNVYYSNTSSERMSPGATIASTINYNGTIKNKFLIEGVFSSQSIQYTPAGNSITNISGIFAIKRNSK